MTDTSSLSIYDEIEIEDMTYDPALEIYHYPCPCGDRFEIAIADLRDGEEIAVCPSCSLMVRVIFDVVYFPSSALRPTPPWAVSPAFSSSSWSDDLPKEGQDGAATSIAVQA
ncbi:diphthamide biosynthesis protein 3 [Polytolypa hystricis UAMH7299]|uniref:Diphthamide biosynthesis protein 3 n=1 Tax=Polytolypa hystricis (strain UAMH7299) TaxID=1447883 RepID=A0A2B7Z2I9_POLH7|nr:diphthamide biosynthesis protein 3 [Polytolypa hystricis UAMH7299]